MLDLGLVRWLNERILGVDRRRRLPRWAARTLAARWSRSADDAARPRVILFNDTFTNYFHPEVGLAATAVLERAGIGVDLGPSVCCGRPLISQGLLDQARRNGRELTRRLHGAAVRGQRIVVLEPSCLTALTDDVPSLLRDTEQEHARHVADACMLFEDFLEGELSAGRAQLALSPGPAQLLLHGHCHQKSLGLVEPAMALLGRIPGATVTDLDAGCCGMAGSFGYARDHFDVSRTIAERRLLPAVREMTDGTVLVASGTSCRHQVHDFTGVRAHHAAEVLHTVVTADNTS